MGIDAVDRRTFNQILAMSVAATALPAAQTAAQAKKRRVVIGHTGITWPARAGGRRGGGPGVEPGAGAPSAPPAPGTVTPERNAPTPTPAPPPGGGATAGGEGVPAAATPGMGRRGGGPPPPADPALNETIFKD